MTKGHRFLVGWLSKLLRPKRMAVVRIEEVDTLQFLREFYSSFSGLRSTPDYWPQLDVSVFHCPRSVC